MIFKMLLFTNTKTVTLCLNIFKMRRSASKKREAKPYSILHGQNKIGNDFRIVNEFQEF